MPQTVGILWTSDHPDAENCTWQHTTFTRDRPYITPAGFEPAIQQAGATADPRLRLRGDWDRHYFEIHFTIILPSESRWPNIFFKFRYTVGRTFFFIILKCVQSSINTTYICQMFIHFYTSRRGPDIPLSFVPFANRYISRNRWIPA